MFTSASGAGALLSGREVNIRMTGDVVNSGTIAGRTILNLAANNLQNIGGILNADSTSITAAQDINNTGGRIAAQNALALNAGRDINITSTSQSSATQIGASSFSRTSIDRIAGLYVTNAGGTLVASAGRDVNIQAGVVSNTGQAGQTTIAAAGNINLTTLTTAESANSVRDARNFVRFSQSQEVGSQITTEGNLTLNAGANINARAANIQSSQGTTNLSAAGNVNLTEGRSTRSLQEAQFATNKGFLSSRSFTSRQTEDSTQSIGTNVGGNTVNVTANKDINIKGSSVIADTNATLTAGNNINIQAATNTASNTSFTETKQSGFLSGGGFGITYGSRTQSLEQKSQSTTAAASTVGAITGNININAGQTYKQVGSDLIAPAGDINITAKKVDIVEARETSQTTTEQKFKQSGITVSISNPVVSAIQSTQGIAQAAGQTSSGRMKALAAASTGLSAYSTYSSLTDKAGNFDAKAATDVRINVSIGTSKSQSNSSSQSDTARGSTVGAGNNINITATGADKSAGQQSDVTIQGSSVKAGNTTSLTADNQVNLLAARNEASQTSTNSSSSSSIGASFSAKGISATASASRGSGRSDGQDTTFTNTNVSAGNTAAIQSGGDTNVKGASVEADTIKANIGGSLKVESLQDTSTFNSSQRSANASISVPITGAGSFGGSVGASKSNVDSSFASVGQKSGLKAGDGGFQVNVAKNTALVGAVIASNQAALENARNSFRTGGSLSIIDIQNTASFKGTASGATVGVGSELGKSGAGVGSMSGNASSTSSAGISGMAGNTAVRTGDAETGLKPIFDADKVQKDINAQVAITTAFGQQASKTIGDYAKGQLLQAEAKQVEGLVKQQQANKARSDGRDDDAALLQGQADAALQQAGNMREQWGETGTTRIALHTLAGLLGGGVGGAAGAAASTLTAPAINTALQSLDLPEPVRQTLVSGAAAILGGAAGGTAGAASALNEAANNYLTSTQELQRDKEIAACKTLACTVGTKLKYGRIDAMQNVGLIAGVGGGIGYQSVDQAVAIVNMIINLPETLTALNAIVSDPEFRAKVGDQIANDYKERIAMQTRAYNDGGWGGSITAGVEAGRLAVDIVSLGTAALGAGKIVAKTASAGGAVVADAATTMTANAAKVFASLDEVSQAKWLSQTATWRAATTELAAMELQAGGKSHPLLRHGDQVELAQLQVRATSGLTPDGVQKVAVDSTRWLKNEDMLSVVKQAQAKYAAGDFGSGTAARPSYEFDMGRNIGEGFYQNSTTYGVTSKATVYLDSRGLPATAFPQLAKLPK